MHIVQRAGEGLEVGTGATHLDRVGNDGMRMMNSGYRSGCTTDS